MRTGEMGNNMNGAANGKRAGWCDSFLNRAASEKASLLLLDALGNKVHP